MGNYKVRISARALRDLESIVKYIREDSPQNAVEVAAAVVKLINSLIDSPRRFRLAGFSRRRNSPVHVTNTPSFMIYYKVDEMKNDVEIITVVRSSRRQPQRFA